MTADTPGTLDTGQKMEGFKFHPSFLLSKHKTEKMDIKKKQPFPNFVFT